ncbi:hypothetical protein U0070_015165 [Myodes glareolus]|uniref:Uncharacterized protein n=1 Tax=Myodes glareolus TaxID=447135 RepID=A0AAW0H6I8_MYOGA
MDRFFTKLSGSTLTFQSSASISQEAKMTGQDHQVPVPGLSAFHYSTFFITQTPGSLLTGEMQLSLGSVCCVRSLRTDPCGQGWLPPTGSGWGGQEGAVTNTVGHPPEQQLS